MSETMATTLQQQIEKMKAKLERQARIVAAYASGKTMRAIADDEGLSFQRIQQIIRMAEQDEEASA